jgi:hypothetical protein
MMMSDYIGDLYQLRRQTLAAQRQDRVREAEGLADAIHQNQQFAREAQERGDIDTARYYMSAIMEDEVKFQELALELQPPDQRNQMTPAKAEYLAKHADKLAKPHWSGLGINNLGAIAYAHDRAAQMGIPEDSPEYFAALDVVGPQGDSTNITSGDEALSLVRQSKYGKDLTAKQYNANAKTLYQLKRKGMYRD